RARHRSSGCVSWQLLLGAGPHRDAALVVVSHQPSRAYSPARLFPFTARLTTLTGHSPESTRRTSLGAPAWRPTMAFSLYQATCGLMTTLSRSRSGCGLGRGSGSVVSSAHPAIFFASRARTRASVSTTGPREQLMRYAVGFIRASVSSLIIFR